MSGIIDLYQSSIPTPAVAGAVRLLALAGELEATNDSGQIVGFNAGYQHTATTEDDVPFVLAAVAIPEETVWLFVAHVVGHVADYSAAAGRVLVATVRRPLSGNVVQVGTDHSALMEDSTGSPDITASVDTSTQTWRVLVTGVASEDWQWRARVLRVRLA